MGTTDDTSKKRPARNTPTRNTAAPNVSPETSRSPTTLLEQAIETERRRLLHVHGVLHCLYEVLLYADGEDAVLYAEAAHLAAIMVDESVERLDSTRIKPLIDALKTELGGHGGGGFMVREPPPPPYLLS
jgi:hypothetical protein